MAINDVLLNFDKVIKDMARKAEKAVSEVGADLLKESNEICPISPIGTVRKDGTKSGDLRKSGKLKLEKKGNSIAAVVSYGDSRVTYAAAVHEINKNYNEPGTGWKYLERPLKKNAKRYLNYMRKKIGDKL